MYDELIAELRQHHCDAKEDDTQEVCEECAYDVIIADKSVPSGIASVCVCGLMNEAADAIKGLQKAVNFHKFNSEFWKDKYNSLADKKWIPVTERKPKTDDIVLVAIHDDSGDTPYDVTNVGFYLDVFPLGIWVVENERCNYVTHWMPLPEPPENK